MEKMIVGNCLPPRNEPKFKEAVILQTTQEGGVIMHVPTLTLKVEGLYV